MANMARHTASLAGYQDADVDPLIRQQVLGHRPTTSSNGLGTTAAYTHTRPETQRQQVEGALRRWPASLRYAVERIGIAATRGQQKDRP
jgi:hypothetical protein